MKEQKRIPEQTVFQDTADMMDNPFKLQYYLIAVLQISLACEMYLTGILSEQAKAYRMLEYWGLDPFKDEIHAAKIMKAAKDILRTYEE